MNNIYITVLGDMWDTIAYKVLGGERHTDKLIKENLQYKESFIFPAGIVLKLPMIEPEDSSTLPPWKKVK